MYMRESVTFSNFPWGCPMDRCVCRGREVRCLLSETVELHISGRFSLRPILFEYIYVVFVIYPEFRIPDPDGLFLLQNFLS